jgi:hypothetical protein
MCVPTPPVYLYSSVTEHESWDKTMMPVAVIAMENFADL